MSRLAKPDFLDAVPFRTEALVHRHAERFHGRRERGVRRALVGWVLGDPYR